MVEIKGGRKHVVVIGGGAVGLCAAYYLHEGGHRVTVLEKGDFEEGASLGNAGMLVPSHVVPLAAPGVISQGMRWLFRRDSPFRIKPRLDPALAGWLWQFRSFCNEQHVQSSMPLLRDLSLASVDLYAELSKAFAFQFERRGLLMLHNSTPGAQENLKYAKLARQAGLTADVLDADALLKLEPGIRTETTGGVYYPQDAHLSPGHFMRALKKYLEARGVDCRPRTAVTGCSRRKQKIETLHTSTGEVPADEIILAAGSWSPEIGRMFGLKLPIQPAKGYSVTMNAPENPPGIPMILTEAKVTVTPMGDQLRFGGTLELAGYDASVDRMRASSILRTIPRYLPGLDLSAVKTETIWAGYRPCTPDGLPMIGRTRSLKNLIIATGHAMIGITLAPITGRLVMQLVNGDLPDIYIDALNPDRFISRRSHGAANGSFQPTHADAP